MKFMKDGSGANGNTISQPDFSPPPHPTSMYPPLVIPIHSNVVRFFFINYIWRLEERTNKDMPRHLKTIGQAHTTCLTSHTWLFNTCIVQFLITQGSLLSAVSFSKTLPKCERSQSSQVKCLENPADEGSKHLSWTGKHSSSPHTNGFLKWFPKWLRNSRSRKI